jgi:hypothetical protein
MADSTGQVTLLMNSGIDAFTNLYDIQMVFPTNVTPSYDSTATSGAGGYAYSVRAMGFQPPELTLMIYNSDYKGVQLTKQAPKIQGERTFTIEFRMDTNYYLYYDLLQWKHIWVDPSGEGNIQPGSLSDNIMDSTTTPVTGNIAQYGQITVGAYSVTTPLDGYSDPSNVVDITSPGASWIFWDVVCNKVGTPNYQRAGADAVTVTAEFIFGRYSEPYSNGSPLALATPGSTIPALTGNAAN